jgi:hypothetical protein
MLFVAMLNIPTRVMSLYTFRTLILTSYTHFRPLLHALYNPGIKAAFGMDLDQVKVSKADAFIRNTVAEMTRKGVMLGETKSGDIKAAELPKIHCGKVEDVSFLKLLLILAE